MCLISINVLLLRKWEGIRKLLFDKRFKFHECLKLCLFIHSDYSKLPPEGIVVNCIGVLVVAFAGLVMYLVTEPRFKRQPLPEDELLLTSGLE
jgi:hypothetical protein